MKLADLRSRGGIVDRAPIPKEVTWTRTDADGVELSDTFTIYVRKHSFGALERLFTPDEKAHDRSRSAYAISESIYLGEGGVESISYEDAFQLDPTLAAVFLKALNEVNGKKKAGDENPPEPTSSGTT